MSYFHVDGCAREDGPGWGCTCEPRRSIDLARPARTSWLGACRECSADAMLGTSLCADCRDRLEDTYPETRKDR